MAGSVRGWGRWRSGGVCARRVTGGDALNGGSVAPGAPLTLPAAVLREVLTHAAAGAPDETCGLVLGTGFVDEGGRPTRFVPCANAAASPYRYEVDPDELLRLTLDAEDAGEAVWGIVHSHVRSGPVPSPTDLRLAFHPEAVYLIVSLASVGDETAPAAAPEAGAPAAPSLRAWRIRDGDASEVPLAAHGQGS